MLRTAALLFVSTSLSFGQMMDPYLMYGGGMGMYGGMNPYFYNSGLSNYGAYNPAQLLLNPYNMDIQSGMLANYGGYNAMNGGMNNVGVYGAMNTAFNPNAFAGYGAMNPAFNTNSFAGYANGNVLDSGSTLGDSGLRGLRNRLPVMNNDGKVTRLPGQHSLFDCTGVLSSRPCKRTNIGSGSNWENSRDQH